MSTKKTPVNHTFEVTTVIIDGCTTHYFNDVGTPDFYAVNITEIIERCDVCGQERRLKRHLKTGGETWDTDEKLLNEVSHEPCQTGPKQLRLF